ncbi:phage tail tube protein [Nitrosospira sp. NpAV]|uniref:phage tail tube protein n=1 Tax=Nitrosospira sp. NpAV TaxID=58133 RepID=UPI0005A2D388|nr:phage tail tube protein [Nitrosospira sp. NpAV]KIO49595.1 hypothetical protein SQ11_05570 [Nitrosospira sp. NpAV]
MSNQVTGRVFVSVNGKRLASKEGAKLGFGGIEREAVLGDSGVLGYSEKTAVPYVECTIAHKGDTSLKELQDTTDASVTFEADTGKVYMLRNAWSAKAIELDKGEVALRFEGISAEEA